MGEKIKNLILISGKKGSGKDTVADYLRKEYDFKKFAFADELKNMCLVFCNEIMFGADKETGENITIDHFYNEALKERLLSFPFVDDLEEEITPRYIMQKFGTNFIRRYFDENYWIKNTIMNIKNKNWENNAISDLRYKNELNVITAELAQYYNIYTIRISRLNPIIPDNHSSEIDLDDYSKWDYIIDNNDGTLEDLYDHVDIIMNSIYRRKKYD